MIYQLEIQYFFPLTEQIPLDLDYIDCPNSGKSVLFSEGTNLTFATPTWSTNISPQLTITPINSVGQLSIGGISVGLESEPKWYQKLLYKALGFKWK